MNDGEIWQELARTGGDAVTDRLVGIRRPFAAFHEKTVIPGCVEERRRGADVQGDADGRTTQTLTERVRRRVA